eukprot:scaffold25818_cov64-Phaeocystis_antarctica.AAC.1
MCIRCTLRVVDERRHRYVRTQRGVARQRCAVDVGREVDALQPKLAERLPSSSARWMSSSFTPALGACLGLGRLVGHVLCVVRPSRPHPVRQQVDRVRRDPRVLGDQLVGCALLRRRIPRGTRQLLLIFFGARVLVLRLGPATLDAPRRLSRGDRGNACMVCMGCVHGVRMVCAWCVCGVCMACACGVRGARMGLGVHSVYMKGLPGGDRRDGLGVCVRASRGVVERGLHADGVGRTCIGHAHRLHLACLEERAVANRHLAADTLSVAVAHRHLRARARE